MKLKTIKWVKGFNLPRCSLCGGMARNSKLNKNRWVCLNCNEVISFP